MTPVTLPPETCAALVDVEDDTPVWIAVKGERWEAPVGANELGLRADLDYRSCSGAG